MTPVSYPLNKGSPKLPVLSRLYKQPATLAGLDKTALCNYKFNGNNPVT